MKRNLILLTLALMMAVPVFSQQDPQKLYMRKVASFTRMKNAGWTMTGVGSGCVVAGTILLATLPSGYWSTDYTYGYYEDYDESDDLQAAGGIIGICLGVGLLAGGITMGSIGSRKVRSYQQKLNNLSIGMICTPKTQGLTLTFRF
jgi:hypothetical protein